MVGAYLGTIYIYNNTKCGYNTYYHPGKLYIILAMQQCVELSRNVDKAIFDKKRIKHRVVHILSCYIGQGSLVLHFRVRWRTALR
jgi:hypothetical protein